MYKTDSDLPIKILVVDDDSLYKKLFINFLQDDSYFKVIGAAGDGQTAVSLAKELSPDVIIMNIGLPDMSGIEATKIIKEANASIKIIILTAYTNLEEAKESLSAGATAYVNKDIDMQHFRMIIQAVYNEAIWLPLIILSQIWETHKVG